MQYQGQLPPVSNNFYQNPQNNVQGLPTNTNEYIPLNQPQSYQPQYNQQPQYNYQTPIVQPFKLPLPANNTQPQPQYNQQPQYYQAQGGPANYQIPIIEPFKFPLPNNNQVAEQPINSNAQNIVQGYPDNQVLQPPLTVQSNQQATQLTHLAQMRFDLHTQFANFPLKYAAFVAIYFVLFCGEVFIQRYLFGYVITYAFYLSSIVVLVCSSLQICIGNEKRRCCCKLRMRRSDSIVTAFLMLVAFLIAQILGFAYAIKYPLRYQMDNEPANDAMTDYTDYYNSHYQICEKEKGKKCYETPAVYKMSDTCKILQKIFVDNFNSKSYASYCSQVLAGSEEDIDYDYFSPLSTGLIFYFAIGLLGALIITFYLGKQLYHYRKALKQKKDFKKAEKLQGNQNKIPQQHIKVGASSKYNK